MITHGCAADGTVVRVCGDVDIATAPELHEQVVRLIEAGHRVVVDLAGVGFMDCSGLEVLLTCQRRAAAAGTVLVLRRPSPRVMRLLQLTALEPAFTIEASRVTVPAQR